MDRQICLFVCGDVMTGRGIDQILPHPGKPRLFEPYVRDARDYVRLAEAAYGPIPHRIDYDYLWGDALEELGRADVRIVNLETSITTNDDYWLGKDVHYRMNPRNIACLTAARIDCCTLANNHVLDWGYEGLAETLATLDRAGISHAGAGANAQEAESPAIIDVARPSPLVPRIRMQAMNRPKRQAASDEGRRARILVFSFGSMTSGIPPAWRAAGDRPGVNLLAELSEETGRRVTAQIQRVKGPGDVVVASIHWGSNWGYRIPQDQIRLAHRLIEEGADLVHGHSSHHAKALEIYQGHPILYGCGDCLTDYEGITGHEAFRGDLAVMYFITLDLSQGQLPDARPPRRAAALRGSGPAGRARRPAAYGAESEAAPRRAESGLVELRLVPMQVRHFRLNRASAADAQWLHRMLDREGAPFGTQVSLQADNSLTVRLPQSPPTR